MIVEKDITTQSHLPNFTESTISAADMAKTLEIIANIYSKPKDAVLRELVANGIDSHRVAGTTDPVIVTMPSKKFPEIIIADTGTGLSLEECENIYGNYMRSTKRDTNDAIGHFGMGSKSPYSVTNQFSIEAVKDGKLTVIIFGIHPDTGAPGHSILAHVDTDRVNGLTVKIPVDTSDEELDDWHEALRRVSYFWSENDVVVKAAPLSPYASQVRLSSQRWDSLYPGSTTGLKNSISEHGFLPHAKQLPDRATVRMGPIGYTIPQSMNNELFGHVILNVPVGALTIDPSRENIKDTAENKIAIKHYEKLFLEDFAESWRAVFSDATSLLEAHALQKLTSTKTIRCIIRFALCSGLDLAIGFDHIDKAFEKSKHLPVHRIDAPISSEYTTDPYLEYSMKHWGLQSVFKKCDTEINLDLLHAESQRDTPRITFIDTADVERYTLATARAPISPCANKPVLNEKEEGVDYDSFLKQMVTWLSPAPRVEDLIKKWMRHKNAIESTSINKIYLIDKTVVAKIADTHLFTWITVDEMKNELAQANKKPVNLAEKSTAFVHFNKHYGATYNAYTQAKSRDYSDRQDAIRTVKELIDITDKGQLKANNPQYTATIVIGTVDEFNTIPTFMTVHNWTRWCAEPSTEHNDYFVSSSGRSQATWAELIGTAVKPWLTLLTVEEFKQREIEALEDRYTPQQWIHIAESLEIVGEYVSAYTTQRNLRELITHTSQVATDKSVKAIAEDFTVLLEFMSDHPENIDKLRQNIPLIQHILPKPVFTQALPTTTGLLKNLGSNRFMPADVLMATLTADLAVIRKAKRRLPRLEK